MKSVFEEYGGLLLCLIAILMLISVALVVISSAENGALGEWLAQEIRNFLETTNN